MGKALLVGAINSTIASGSEATLFGNGSSATEANAQTSMTEACAITGLRHNISANGSGTNTVRLRKNAGNGNNVASRSGVGFAEDASNSDSFSAGDLLNLAMTDTGTDPTFDYCAANVEMSSGHGSFHVAAAVGGVVCDIASAVRYLPINGSLQADGVSVVSIATVQWKVRGYSSIEAFQVRCPANARTNNSVFRVNVNGSDVGTAITFTTGETGLKTVTGMGIALNDGDLVCISLTLLSGTEDLTVSLAGVTMKSASGESEIAACNPTGTVRAASSTPSYCCPGGHLTFGATEANKRIKVGFAARIRNLRIYIAVNSYTGAATLKLMVNGTARITLNITAATNGWFENSSDVWDIGATDTISYEIDEGTANNMTIQQIGVTLAPIPAAKVPSVMNSYRRRRAA